MSGAEVVVVVHVAAELQNCFAALAAVVGIEIVTVATADIEIVAVATAVAAAGWVDSVEYTEVDFDSSERTGYSWVAAKWTVSIARAVVVVVWTVVLTESAAEGLLELLEHTVVGLDLVANIEVVETAAVAAGAFVEGLLVAAALVSFAAAGCFAAYFFVVDFAVKQVVLLHSAVPCLWEELGFEAAWNTL